MPDKTDYSKYAEYLKTDAEIKHEAWLKRQEEDLKREEANRFTLQRVVERMKQKDNKSAVQKGVLQRVVEQFKKGSKKRRV